MKDRHFDYQMDNSLQQKHFQIDLYADFSYHLHLHRDYEFLLVISGKIDIITMEGTETAHAGQMALILPHCVHGYVTAQQSCIVIGTFSGEYVRSFHKQMEQKEAEQVVCDCPAEVREYVLCQLLPEWKNGGEAFYRHKNLYIMAPLPPMNITALLYVLCANYLQAVPLQPAADKPEHQIISRLLNYIQNNYQEDITIASAAQALGYAPSYVSRCLQTAVGLNFRQLVNQCRIDRACDLLRNPELNVTEISMQAGFQSIRSFNRAFLEMLGCTPSQYRKRG